MLSVCYCHHHHAYAPSVSRPRKHFVAACRTRFRADQRTGGEHLSSLLWLYTLKTLEDVRFFMLSYAVTNFVGWTGEDESNHPQQTKVGRTRGGTTLEYPEITFTHSNGILSCVRYKQRNIVIATLIAIAGRLSSNSTYMRL